MKSVISKKNILDKICFVLFGGGLEKYSAELKIALNLFRTTYAGAGAPFSHQVIQNWCDKGQHPSRPDSFSFIEAFLSNSVVVPDLSDARQKVHRQILTFCDYCIRNAKSAQRVFSDAGGRLTIRGSQSQSDYELLKYRLPGIYLTYRMRFSDNKERPISQEVLHVFVQSDELRFEHWFLRDEEALSSFEGSILLVGNLIWFFGATSAPPERLRVMHFRHIRSRNSAHNLIRWGLLSSDIPEPTHEPVTCRIFIEKLQTPFDDAFKFGDNVTYCTTDDLRQNNRPDIIRFVENNTTAHSPPRSFMPATENGHPMIDESLTIDQRTVESYAKYLFPDGNSTE